MRIKGVRSELADLLEAAGVDSVPELAQRSPANLAAKLDPINEARSLVRRVPNGATVADWIAEANTLPNPTGDDVRRHCAGPRLAPEMTHL